MDPLVAVLIFFAHPEQLVIGESLVGRTESERPGGDVEDERSRLFDTQRGSEPGVPEQSESLKYAERISYCESGHRNISNPESSASGYFQFLDSTWYWVTERTPPALDYSFDDQLEAFLSLWDDGEGASHWEPSRYCWEHEEPWLIHQR